MFLSRISKTDLSSKHRCRFTPCPLPSRKRNFPTAAYLFNHEHRFHSKAVKQQALERKKLEKEAIAEAARKRKAQQTAELEYAEDRMIIEGGTRAATEAFVEEQHRREDSVQGDLDFEHSDFEDLYPVNLPTSNDPFPTLPTKRTVENVSRRLGEEESTEQDGDVTMEDVHEDYGISDHEVFRTEEHPTADQIFGELRERDLLFPKDKSPLLPFKSAEDWKVGSWLIKGNAPTDMITKGFNSGILQQHGSTKKTTITSVHTLRDRIDKLEPTFGKDSWMKKVAIFFGEKQNRKIKYHHRDPNMIIRHFFKQPVYADTMVYKPVRYYNEKGDRILSEIFTADWVWEKQETIRIGGFLIPVFFSSDGTQLSSHSGGHKFWPLYMSIGNIPSGIRDRPSNNAWVLVAQLPIPPSMRKYDKKRDGGTKKAWTAQYQAYKEDAFGACIRDIFAPFKDSMDGMEIECADGKLRLGFPVVAAWIADFQEYNKLYTTKTKGCCLCEVSENQLGDNIIAAPRNAEEHSTARQDYRQLLMKIELNNRLATTKLTTAEKERVQARRERYAERLHTYELYFHARQSKPIDNALWKTGVADIQDVWKPDILHTIYEGMFSHVLTALERFLEAHKRIGAFEDAWMRLEGYKDIPAPKESIFTKDQRTGKALRNALRRILPVLVIALDKPSAAQLSEFHDCLCAVRYLVDFSLVTTYRFHTETSIGYLESYLDGFHRHKSVFNKYRTAPDAVKHSSKAKKKMAKAQRQKDIEEANEEDRWTSEVSSSGDNSFGIESDVEADDENAAALAPRGRSKPNVKSKAKRRNDNHNRTESDSDADDEDAVTATPKTRSQGKVTSPTNPVLAEAEKERTTRAASARRETKTRLLKQVDLLMSSGIEKLQKWLYAGVKGKHIPEYSEDAVANRIEELSLQTEIRHLDRGAYWKIPKLHLLCHFKATIRRFGALQQYSSEIGESLHKGVKEAYRFSNRKDHTKQILQFHTRKWAIRMRELNLFCIARRGQWQSEIQEALSLYGSREDRLLAARMHRKGEGSLAAYHARKIALEQAETQQSASVLLPTDEIWNIPPPRPLFAAIVKEAAGRKISAQLQTGSLNIAKLENKFDIPNLSNAIQEYLVTELEIAPRKSVAPKDIRHLRAEAWSTLTVTTESIQSNDPLEAHKIVCTGPYQAAHSKTPRNDAILYRDQDEYATLSKRKGLQTDFKEHRCGLLKCIFKIWIPKKEYWKSFVAGPNNCPISFFELHYLTYFQPLVPVRVDKDGEMIPGPEVARCVLPTRNLNDGRVMDVNSILRGAQLVAQHGEEVTEDSMKAWVVNNRIDLSIWDIIYSKRN